MSTLASRRMVTIPAPPADRVPIVRAADCRYCDRYCRACGRHDAPPVKTVTMPTEAGR